MRVCTAYCVRAAQRSAPLLSLLCFAFPFLPCLTLPARLCISPPMEGVRVCTCSCNQRGCVNADAVSLLWVCVRLARHCLCLNLAVHASKQLFRSPYVQTSNARISTHAEIYGMPYHAGHSLARWLTAIAFP